MISTEDELGENIYSAKVGYILDFFLMVKSQDCE